MHLGIGLGVVNGGSHPWTPANLTNAKFVARADKGKTLNGPTVSAWADQSGHGNNVTQGTAAAQPTDSTSFLSFDGGDGLIAASVSPWQFMHDGSGMVVGIRYRATSAGANVVVATCSGSTSVGLLFQHDGANQRSIFTIGNGSAIAVLGLTADSTLLNNADHTMVIWYKEGLSPAEWAIRIDGSLVASGDSSLAPPVGDSTHELTIGAGGGISNPLTGRIYRVAIAASVPSAAELAKLEQWLGA